MNNNKRVICYAQPHPSNQLAYYDGLLMKSLPEPIVATSRWSITENISCSFILDQLWLAGLFKSYTHGYKALWLIK
jgi:hypothetical protein